MLARLHTYASFVRFSHSVFALPFALTGALLAFRLVPFGWMRVVWIVVCMVAARSAAMGFNRLVDASFDARNPRTAMRELPRGRMSRARGDAVRRRVLGRVRPGGGRARPACLCAVARRARHRVLVLAGQALHDVHAALPRPGDGRRARRRMDCRRRAGTVGTRGCSASRLGRGSAGFDVLYACQDVEFDRREGLRSIPVRFGVRQSLVDLARRCMS